MAKALEEITRDAIQLPRPQRLALAGFLLELDDCGDDVEVEAAWEHEILARIQAVDDCPAVGVAYEDVMREAQKRLAHEDQVAAAASRHPAGSHRRQPPVQSLQAPQRKQSDFGFFFLKSAIRNLQSGASPSDL